MDDDAYEALLAEQEQNAAIARASRPDVRDPDGRAARLAADQAAADRAIAIEALTPSPGPHPAAGAMARNAEETGSAIESARRERERFAYALYSQLRSEAEIRAALCTTYGISEATARDDLRAVRAIVASWRDHMDWIQRRDQHMTALRGIVDRALARGDDKGLEIARKTLADMRAVEGFTAPTRGVVVHGHGVLTDTTLPDGPGVIAGLRILDLTPGQRSAMLALLPPEAIEASQDAAGDAIDAASVEAGTPPAARLYAIEQSLDPTAEAEAAATAGSCGETDD